MRDRPPPTVFVLAIFGAAFAVIARPWLSGAVTIPWDAKAQFYPQVAFLARALSAGASPAWTPNVFAGWPQLADPQSLIFSPLHLAVAAVSPAPDFRLADAATFLALFLGGCGIIFYFRDRGWSAAGGLVAALVFCFGGVCAARLQHTGQILSIAWFPLALFLLSRALERSSILAGALAGLFAALIALGRDQVALLALYALVAVVFVHWFAGSEGWRTRIRRSLLPLAVGAVVGAVLIAVPMLLTVLLTGDSNRPAIDLEGAGRGSLHPAHLMTFAVPDLFGANDPDVPYWGPASFPWGETGLFLAQNMGQVYAGALALVAILGIGLVGGALLSRAILFATLATAATLLYALGWYTPAFPAFHALLPGVSLFRRPADAAFVFNAWIAIAAGYCAHRWLEADARLFQRSVVGATFALLAIFVVALSLAVWKGMLKSAIPEVLLAGAWTGGALLALGLAWRYRAHSLLPALVLAAFATADFRFNHAPNESNGLPPAMYDALRPDTQNETIALLRERLAATGGGARRDRIELAGIGYHWPNASLVHGFDHDFGHNPLRLRDFAQATGVGDTIAVGDQRTFSPLFPSYRSAMADLFGLRFIATGVPAEEIDKALKPDDLNAIARTKDAYVYENPRALPRAMLVASFRVADFAALMREGWPAEADPRAVVLLETAPSLAPSGDAASGSVRIARYTNTEVVIETDAPEPRLLVLNDVWHPWWRATIGGAPAPILKANVIFRAVAVPAGKHTVRFTFHPVAGALEELRSRMTSK